MLRTRPSFDWLMAEADEEWEAAVEVEESRVRHGFPRKRKISLITGACLLVALCLASIVLYHRAEQSLDRIETEIDTVVKTEQWTHRQTNLDVSNALIDPEAPETWKRSLHANSSHGSTTNDQPVVQVHDFKLDGERALVRVLVDKPDDPWHTVSYLETRFYRRTDLGWLRTAPSVESWGKIITADSDYFVVVYRQRDAMAVQEVMADIDKTFTALCHELGTEPISTAEPLHIIVQPSTLPPTDPGEFRFYDNRLILPSPQQMPMPIEMTEAEVLRASILEPLAVRIVESQMDLRPGTHAWPVLRDGLGLWLRQKYGVLPSASRLRLASKLVDGQDIDSARLDNIATYSTLYTDSPYDGDSNMQRQAAAFTMVSYAMEKYGSSTLPLLVKSMDSCATWEELIATVFGVPAKEFEAGWQTYLVSEYRHFMR